MKVKKKRKTDEEYRQLIMNLRIIDDIFFDEYIADADACEELLQVVLDNPKIRIKRESLDPQKSIRIVGKRSVHVDAYVEGEEDVVYNIEIQRSDSCNHVKRVRYHASVITVKNSEPGDDFKDVQDVSVIYISEFDMFSAGKTIYHVENVIRETGETVNDGLRFVYVNTTCKDGSKLSDLMTHFTETDFSDVQFPKSSERMHKLKHDERLVGKMCKQVQDFAEDMARDLAEDMAKGLAEDMAKGLAEDMARDLAEDMARDIAETRRLEERQDAIRRMINKGCSKEFVMDLGYSEKEYHQAEAL